MGEDGREGKGDLGEAQGASGPKQNLQGRLSCREGWEAEQVSVAEAARERETRRARDGGRGGVLTSANQPFCLTELTALGSPPSLCNSVPVCPSLPQFSPAPRCSSNSQL